MKPTVYTYTALMDAMRRAGRYSSVMKLFEQMVNDDLEPTLHTYSVVLDSLGKQGDLKGARMLFDHIKALVRLLAPHASRQSSVVPCVSR
jgi:pentatricopeptide repeat protein